MSDYMSHPRFRHRVSGYSECEYRLSDLDVLYLFRHEVPIANFKSSAAMTRVHSPYPLPAIMASGRP